MSGQAVLLFVCLAALMPPRFQTQKLLFAQVIYRHGARAPGQTYPNDPWQLSYWTNGPDQLTLVPPILIAFISHCSLTSA